MTHMESMMNSIVAALAQSEQLDSMAADVTVIRSYLAAKTTKVGGFGHNIDAVEQRIAELERRVQ